MVAERGWKDMEIVFPANPSQWQLHCHVVSLQHPDVRMRNKNTHLSKFKRMLTLEQFVRAIRTRASHPGHYAGRVTTDMGVFSEHISESLDYQHCDYWCTYDKQTKHSVDFPASRHSYWAVSKTDD